MTINFLLCVCSWSTEVVHSMYSEQDTSKCAVRSFLKRIVVTLKLVLKFSLSVVKNGGHILHRILLNVRLGDCDFLLLF